jgi:thioredoxin reductase
MQPCIGQPVVIVGGGNSAGQAAMFISTQASHVHMLVRGPQLSSTMSDYLVQRIHASKGKTIHPCSEVVEIDGKDRLSHVIWQLTKFRPAGASLKPAEGHPPIAQQRSTAPQICCWQGDQTGTRSAFRWYPP